MRELYTDDNLARLVSLFIKVWGLHEARRRITLLTRGNPLQPKLLTFLDDAEEVTP